MSPFVYLALPVLALLVAGCHKTLQTPETSSLPVALWLDYSDGEGESFHFNRARTAHGEIRNEYSVNPDFDPEARYLGIDISLEAWAKFRRAVEAIDFAGMNDQYEFPGTPGAARWSIHLEYSDLVVTACSFDRPTTIADFAKLRLALNELTSGKAFGSLTKAAEPDATANRDSAAMNSESSSESERQLRGG